MSEKIKNPVVAFLLRIIPAAMIVALLVYLFTVMDDAGRLLRIRILMGTLSVAVFSVTIMTIRNYKLREKYAVLWLVTAGLIIIAAIWPRLIENACRWLGIQYASALGTIIFIFLLLIAFHVSIALSALNDKVSAIATRCAILEAHIRELEKKVPKDGNNISK